ncbi:MAG: amidohydrolase family protein, partial [Gemmataceae bacterium]
MRRRLLRADAVFADEIRPRYELGMAAGRFAEFPQSTADEILDFPECFVVPGFIDLHVHGGGGADFMDLTPEAFRTICRTHAKHGTTALTPTSTVDTTTNYDRFMKLCDSFRGLDTGGARVVGTHLYGPYFERAARGCHPDQDFPEPSPEELRQWPTSTPGFPLTVTI